MASCVSGLGGGEEGLAGAWVGFTVSLMPQIKKAEMDRKTLAWEAGLLGSPRGVLLLLPDLLVNLGRTAQIAPGPQFPHL